MSYGTERRGRVAAPPHPNSTWLGETWLEPEELCQLNPGWARRCRAICEDGRLRVFRVGLPDTFFSIPTRGGFVCKEDFEGLGERFAFFKYTGGKKPK